MPMTFGAYLRALRIDAGFRMVDAATEVRVSVPYWSDIENERRNPFKGELLDRVVKLFKDSADEKKLRELARVGGTKISISLVRKSPRQADLIVRFARVIDDLDEGQLDKLDTILRGGADESAE